MRLSEVVVSIVFVAVFLDLFNGIQKTIFANHKTRQKIEKTYNCDKFIAESFLKCCGEGELGDWISETKSLTSVESLEVVRIYENNPNYLKAVWVQGEKSMECLGVIASKDGDR